MYWHWCRWFNAEWLLGAHSLSKGDLASQRMFRQIEIAPGKCSNVQVLTARFYVSSASFITYECFAYASFRIRELIFKHEWKCGQSLS